jgi:hypothetical protein
MKKTDGSFVVQMAEILDFTLLDDIMGLPPDERYKILKASEIQGVGPLVELVFHHRSSDDDLFHNIREDQLVSSLFSLINKTDTPNASSFGNSLFSGGEFIRPPRTIEEIENEGWTDFLLRAQSGAERSGMDEQFAKAIVATLEEMTDNIIWHSDSTDTGLVGYQWSDHLFEYAVADAGIGVLASLKKCPDYIELNNSGDAIKIAHQNGISRFGNGASRGFGFNLLLNIAKKSSCLRFHSGDATVTLDGVTAYQTNSAPLPITRPAANLQGFTISVSCRTPQ